MTVPLGQTRLSEAQVKDLLRRMAPQWPGSEYHILHNNCLNFSRELCEELGVRHVPGWIDRAARAGSFLDEKSRTVVDSFRENADVARAIASDVREIAESASVNFDRNFGGE